MAKRGNTQERKGYLSYYLWMLGYVKSLEQRYGLEKFGAANLLLNKFANLDKLSSAEKDAGVAELIGIKEDVLFNSLTL